MKKLILASTSPRRREIMTQIGLDFEIISPECDENIEDPDPAEFVEQLSGRKALAGAELVKCSSSGKTDSIVIGADTVVAYDGRILGKPRNKEEAFEMLSFLSGNTHSVYTGVSVLDIDSGKMITFNEKTDVRFFKLTEEEILSYIDTGEPMDKAGAYGIQGRGAVLVESINGDYFNVVGLPAARMIRVIKELV